MTEPNRTNSIDRWLQRSRMLAAPGILVGTCGFEVTEGATVITELDLSLTPKRRRPVETQIDFNGDGTPEVGLVVGTASVVDPDGHNGVVNAFGINGAEVVFSAGGYPTAFQASSLIGPDLSFGTEIGILAWSSGWVLGDRGNWLGGDEAYLGMKFLIDGAVRYGWLHAFWDPDTTTLKIDRAGYEDDGSAAHVPPLPAYPPNFAIRFGPETDPALGQAELIWPVLRGRTYDLQRSSNLRDWTTIHTVTAANHGELSFLDDAFRDAPKEACYYRVGQQMASPLLLLALGLRRRPAPVLVSAPLTKRAG